MPTPRPASLHNLRENKAERTPRRILVLDTESTWRVEGAREIHLLDCWAARHVIRREGQRPKRVAAGRFEGESAESILELLEQLTASTDTLWLFTRNLSFDLSLTRLPLLLLWAGWRLGRHNLASDAPWAYFAKGSRGLRLADSWSWMPTSVERLGLELGLPRPALPPLEDCRERRLERCRADVEIEATALCQLLDEWDRRRAGAWSLTGPATAWNSMLHTPARDKVIIDPDPQARADERRALYSGMREVSHLGPLEAGRYLELDFSLAHLNVCRRLLLPRRRQGSFDRLELDDWRLRNRFEGLIARARVRTDSPRYPLRLSDGVIHPVGEFWTDLCKPELIEARARGELLEIGPGWAYSLGARMQGWAEQAAAELEGPPTEIPPTWRHFLKMASRAVPGRWGMTVSTEEPGGPSPILEWHLEEAAFGKQGRRGFLVHLAGQWFRVIRDQEAEDSFPAVLAYIQSWTRLLLQRAVDWIGEADVLSRNTDQLWVNARRLRRLGVGLRGSALDTPERLDPFQLALRRLAELTWPLELRIKDQARRLEILSPQHVRTEREDRLAGIPRGASELEPGRFEFWTWPKLTTQLRHGDSGGYVRELRRVRLGEIPAARWSYRCGCTAPPRCLPDGAGGSVLLGPDSQACPTHSEPLRASQRVSFRRALEPLRLPL